MPSSSAASPLPEDDPIVAFLSFSKGAANFSARGWLVPVGDGAWMFVLSDGTPEGTLTIRTPVERSGFAVWVDGHFHHVTSEAPHQ